MVITRISVGVDTSPTSLDALTWSVGLASECGAHVRAVTTWERPLVRGLRHMLTGRPSARVRSRQSREQLEEALERAHIAGRVEPVVLNAAPGPALVAESDRSDLLVVGRTGQGFGRAEQFLLGSVARYCMNFARGHVAVVPRGSTWRKTPTVVVGLDGSTNSIEALTWAIENLPATATIQAVRARMRSFNEVTHMYDDSPGELLETVQRELRLNVDEAASSAPERRTAIIERVETGRARHVLLQPELGADLIVVGSPGHNGATDTMFGSVADHVARNASCPVVIIRPRRPHDDGDPPSTNVA